MISLAEKTCVTCKKPFYVSVYDAARGRGKFCNPNCHRPGASKVNSNFFSLPSSEMAYVLGLLFSDGNLLEPVKEHRHRLSIKSIDLQLIETVKALSEHEGKIFNVGNTQSGNPVYRLEWSHPQIIQDVQQWGISARKTLTSQFPRQLPEQFWGDFIRGLSDGDGCIGVYEYPKTTIRSWTLLGTMLVLDPIPDFFGLDRRIYPYRSIAKLCYQSKKDIQVVWDNLYGDREVPCLERKRQMFVEVLNGKRSAERRKSHLQVVGGDSK